MKVLLIIPNFGNQHTLIKKAAEKIGHEIHMISYDEKKFFKKKPILKSLAICINYLFWISGIHAKSIATWNKINHKIFFDYILFEKTVCENISSVKTKDFDAFILVKGFGFSEITINYIKKQLRPKKCILYQWDTLTHYPEVTSIYKLFDKIYTFDLVDSKKTDNTKYLPTYSTLPQDLTQQSKSAEIAYDTVYVGEFTTYRYSLLTRLVEFFKANNISYKIHLISKNKIINKFLSQEIISSETLSEIELKKLYEHSRVIIDIAHPEQSGYTQRIYDALAIDKKILTTTQSVKHEGFFKEDQIFIWDESKKSLSKNFFKTNHKKNIHTKNFPSVEQWINQVLN